MRPQVVPPYKPVQGEGAHAFGELKLFKLRHKIVILARLVEEIAIVQVQSDFIGSKNVRILRDLARPRCMLDNHLFELRNSHLLRGMALGNQRGQKYDEYH